MPLKDAPKIDRELYSDYTREELLQEIQDLTTAVYHNRQLFEFACKDHVGDFLEVEVELAKAGIPEDDGYGCYPIVDRVRMLAKKVPKSDIPI